MFILHLDLAIKQGGEEAFEAFYRDVFHKAIAEQPGFSQAQLLQDKVPQSRTHRLAIVFENEELQKGWVATELHNQVSSKMMQLIAKVCSADSFEGLPPGRSPSGT